MGSCSSKPTEDQVEVLLRKLYSKYAKHLLPLERSSLFSSLGDPPYSLADVLAPPMVLLLGQYSTGKTTFIQALLGRDYPGMHISAAPATDNFVAILQGNTDDNVPGTALVNDTSKPFHSLKAAFGDNFLQRFRGAYVTSGTGRGTDILDDLVIIDTPGTLDGSGERKYNYPDVMGWFARRAALIIIFFDVNKMGVSTEMNQVLESIKGNEEKIRIVFNKADSVKDTDLTGALGGLHHNLARSMPFPEVPQVYTTSLDTLKDDFKTSSDSFLEMFSKDKKHLLEDINRVRHNIYTRKINLLDKRARMVRNHAYVMIQLKAEQRRYLSCFRRILRPQDREKLLAEIPNLYSRVQREQNRSLSEFLSCSTLQTKLQHVDMDKLPSLSQAKVDKAYKKMEVALTSLSTTCLQK